MIKYVFGVFFLLVCFGFLTNSEQDKIVFFEVNQPQKIKMFWKDEKGKLFIDFLQLKNNLESKKYKLVFAMNGGMFKKDFSPQGLYIENGVEKSAIDTSNGEGNFYLKPNGIFYLDKKNKPSIVITPDFKNSKNVKYATQSGPMLVVKGKINAQFQEKSKNLNIRNGVGILPNGNAIFAISKEEVNFYEFAKFFKDRGCKEALYLDGFVSRMYLPQKKWEQFDGRFGVIITVVE
ncbi:MAG: phosphodiester glycosidase family protein [Limnohabitans sp.]|nr:phosphodiester glycosidase family protein [Limnohabitans sp.]